MPEVVLLLALSTYVIKIKTWDVAAHSHTHKKKKWGEKKMGKKEQLSAPVECW